MRHLMTVALLLLLLPVARAEEQETPGPYDGWTKEQFAADRETKEAEVRKRATEYLTVRTKMTTPCPDCGGSGKKQVNLGKVRTIPCLKCLGTGRRVRRDLDPETVFRFHYGQDRPEAASLRHDLAKGLRGGGIFSVLLPLRTFEIREIRIHGDRATVIAVVRRGNLPGDAGQADRVDVTVWLREDDRWWLLDPLLRIAVDEKHPPPDRPLYPEEERARPRHEPEALPLIEKSAARLAPLPGADGREATFLVKVRPEGSKRDARYRVTIDRPGHVSVEATVFPKSGWKDEQERARAESLWQRRLDGVMSRILAVPLVPSPSDYHLRMEEGAVVGHGFLPPWILRRFVAKFGEDGRPASITWLNHALTPKYVEKDGKLLLSSLEVSVEDKHKLFEVTWKRSSEVWFPLKIVETLGEEETTWRMSGFKVKDPPKPVTGDE